MVRKLKEFLMLNHKIFGSKLDAKTLEICPRIRCWIKRKKDADLLRKDAQKWEKDARKKMLDCDKKMLD